MSDYTKKTQNLIVSLDGYSTTLESRLGDHSSKGVEKVQYADLQEILLLIAKANSNFQGLVASEKVEKAAHKERLAGLQIENSSASKEIRDKCHQKSDSIKKRAASDIKSIKRDVENMQGKAQASDVKLDNAAPSDPSKFLDSRQNVQTTAKNSNYSTIYSSARQGTINDVTSAQGNKIPIAGWVGGGAGVLSWIIGAPFMGGLLIGGIAFGVTWAVLDSKIQASRIKIEQFAAAAHDECLKIRNKYLADVKTIESQHDSKLADQKSKFRSRVAQEEESFERIRARLATDMDRFDKPLSSLARDTQRLINLWVEDNAEFSSRLESEKLQANTSHPTRLLRIGEIWLPLDGAPRRRQLPKRTEQSEKNQLIAEQFGTVVDGLDRPAQFDANNRNLRASNPDKHRAVIEDFVAPLRGAIQFGPTSDSAQGIKVGQLVSEGQSILTIVSNGEKIPISSPFHGFVTEIPVEDGATVEIGDVLVRLDLNETNSATGEKSQETPVAQKTSPKPLVAERDTKANGTSIPVGAATTSDTRQGKLPGAKAQLVVDSVYDGVVTKLNDFGATVRFVDGQEGMVSVSDVADEFVARISDVLNVGQKVKVKYLGNDYRGIAKLSKKAVDQKTGKAAPSETA